MKNLPYSLILVLAPLILALSCKKEDPAGEPKACFSIMEDNRTGRTLAKITFIQ